MKKGQRQSPPELYNVETDVAERTNVIAEYPDIAEALAALLAKYRGEGLRTP